MAAAEDYVWREATACVHVRIEVERFRGVTKSLIEWKMHLLSQMPWDNLIAPDPQADALFQHIAGVHLMACFEP